MPHVAMCVLAEVALERAIVALRQRFKAGTMICFVVIAAGIQGGWVRM